MLILTAVAMLAVVVSADPVAVEKRADGVTVVKDLSHKWRGTFETPVMWENVDLTNCKQIADGVGLKLKITAPIVTAYGRKEGVVYEYWEHPHVEGSSHGGKNVFLNGLFVLAKSLDPKVKELKAAAKAESVKGLVPISFEMP